MIDNSQPETAIDVAGILEGLRAEVRARRLAQGQPEEHPLERDLRRSLDEIELHRVISAHWPLLGKTVPQRMIALVNKLVRRYLRWYINPIVEQQNAYNDAVARALRLLAEAYIDLGEQLTATGGLGTGDRGLRDSETGSAGDAETERQGDRSAGDGESGSAEDRETGSAGDGEIAIKETGDREQGEGETGRQVTGNRGQRGGETRRLGTGDWGLGGGETGRPGTGEKVVEGKLPTPNPQSPTPNPQALIQAQALAEPPALFPDLELRALEPQLALREQVSAHWPLPAASLPQRMIALVNKLVRRYLRWYINPIVEQQNSANAATTVALLAIIRLDAQRRAQTAALRAKTTRQGDKERRN